MFITPEKCLPSAIFTEVSTLVFTNWWFHSDVNSARKGSTRSQQQQCSFLWHSAYFHSALYPSFRRKKNPHWIFRKLPVHNFPHSAFRKIPLPEVAGRLCNWTHPWICQFFTFLSTTQALHAKQNWQLLTISYMPNANIYLTHNVHLKLQQLQQLLFKYHHLRVKAVQQCSSSFSFIIHAYSFPTLCHLQPAQWHVYCVGTRQSATSQAYYQSVGYRGRL